MPKSVGRDPDQYVIQKAYARWAPIYDIVCGPIFENGRRAAARAAREVGGRILEIGVGTGLSFDDYDNSTEVVGIDLSAPMIARAKARLANGQYPYVKDILQMDAADLDFKDQSFDCVVGQFVITLVADPERVLSECARVLKPGGQIILVNHLYSETGVAAATSTVNRNRSAIRPAPSPTTSSKRPASTLTRSARSARTCVGAKTSGHYAPGPSQGASIGGVYAHTLRSEFNRRRSFCLQRGCIKRRFGRDLFLILTSWPELRNASPKTGRTFRWLVRE